MKWRAVNQRWRCCCVTVFPCHSTFETVYYQLWIWHQSHLSVCLWYCNFWKPWRRKVCFWYADTSSESWDQVYISGSFVKGQCHRSKKALKCPATPSVTDMVLSHCKCTDGKACSVIQGMMLLACSLAQQAAVCRLHSADSQPASQVCGLWICDPQTDYTHRLYAQTHTVCLCSHLQVVCLKLKGNLVYYFFR